MLNAEETQRLLSALERIAAALELQVQKPAAKTLQKKFKRDIPLCPLCGANMLLKSNRSNGNQFWGCSTYPKCYGKLSIEPEALKEGPPF